MSYLYVTYVKDDTQYTHQLAAHLIEGGFNIWMCENPASRDALQPLIDQAIQESAALLLIMSPAAQVAPHVMRELGMANQHNKPIKPLLLSGSRWMLLGSLGIEKVSGGQMPGADFLDQLAQVAPRKPGEAKNITPEAAQAASHAPADHDNPELTSLSRPAGLRQLADIYRSTLQTSDDGDAHPTSPRKPEMDEKPTEPITPPEADDEEPAYNNPGMTSLLRPKGLDKLTEIYRSTLQASKENQTDKDDSSPAKD